MRWRWVGIRSGGWNWKSPAQPVFVWGVLSPGGLVSYSWNLRPEFSLFPHLWTQPTHPPRQITKPFILLINMVFEHWHSLLFLKSVSMLGSSCEWGLKLSVCFQESCSLMRSQTWSVNYRLMQRLWSGEGLCFHPVRVYAHPGVCVHEWKLPMWPLLVSQSETPHLSRWIKMALLPGHSLRPDERSWVLSGCIFPFIQDNWCIPQITQTFVTALPLKYNFSKAVMSGHFLA